MVLLFIAIILLSTLQSIAQASQKDLTELSIEELMNIPVYGASKYEQKTTEAPASVTIITRDEIKKYGNRTLAEILSSVPGFYITNDRNYSYIGLRGLNRPGDYNVRILLLVDGHRINDNIYDQALIGTEFPVDIDLIDRVEVIKGPGSSLYGTNAFLGVINVITRRGRDLKGSEISGQAGSFNTYQGRFSYGNKFKGGLEVLASGTYHESQGPRRLFFPEFLDYEQSNGRAINCDFNRFYNFFTKASYQDFTLEGVLHSREKGIPTGAWGIVFNDPRNRTIDTRAYLDLKYDHTFADQWGIMARLYYDHSNYDGYYFYNMADPGNPPNIIKNKDNSRGDWWGSEVQVRKNFFDRHKLIAGAEYRDNFRQNQGNFDEAPFIKYLDDQRKSKIWALYIQDEFTIFKNLILNAGVRHDHYDNFGGSTNPRAALIYNPFPPTTFKLIYGQAFRAPNLYELYYNDGDVTQKASPNLKPEKVTTAEVVWEQLLGKHYRLSASGYYYWIKDLIGQQVDPTDGLLVFRNSERVEARGIELALSGKWARGFEGRLSYTLQEAKNQQTGDLLTNSPKHLAKLNLIAPLIKDRLFTGIELQYSSNRKTLNNQLVGDYLLTNLTIFSKNFLKDLEFSATVYNLFNQRFRDPGAQEHLINGMSSIVQDGRTFRIKFTYNF
jgi:iron complex outermembrane receptor protein